MAKNKITLNDTRGTYDVTQINNNFNKIETALNEEVLYRKNPVDLDNMMESDLDMNGQRILNLPKPQTSNEPVRKVDLDNIKAELKGEKGDKGDPGEQINSDWAATSGKTAILNKPVFAPVATSGLKADVGLSNVDNTSDINKPISIAMANMLDTKAPNISPSFSGSFSLSNPVGGASYIEAAGNGNVAGVSSMLYGQDVASVGYVWNRANAAVVLATSGIERLRVAASGNVMVGTSTDNGADKLQVNGKLLAAGQITSNADATLRGAVGIYSAIHADSRNWRFRTDDLAYGDLVLERSSTLRGEPDTRVLNFTGTTVKFAGAVQAGGILQALGGDINTGTNLSFTWNTLGGHIQSYSGKPLLINELGNNVLIGTTVDNAADKLQVAGSLSASNIKAAGAFISTVAGVTTVVGADASGSYVESQGANNLRLYTNGAERFRVAATGNIQIGALNDYGYKLQVFGALAGGRSNLPVVVADNAGVDYGNDVFIPHDGGSSTQKAFRLRASYNNGSGLFAIGRATNTIAQYANPSGLTYTNEFSILGNGNIQIGDAVDNGRDKLRVGGSLGTTGALYPSGGLHLVGAATVGVTTPAGVMGLWGSDVRCYVGDGTGWSWRFSKRSASTTTDIVTILDSGSVGIGTSAPSSRLEIQGTDYNGLTISRDNSTTGGGTLLNFREKASDGAWRNQNLFSSYWANSTAGAESSILSLSQYVGGASSEVLRVQGGNIGLSTTPKSTGTSSKSIEIGAGYYGAHVSTGSVAIGSNVYHSSGTDMRKGAYASTMYDASNGKHAWKIAPTGGADTAISWTTAMTVDTSANLLIGPSTLTGSCHIVQKSVAEGSNILLIQNGPVPTLTATFGAVAATGYSTAGAALYVGKNSVTSRSLNAGGTVNASGADYAEYMTKAEGCGEILKGAVVGVDSLGKLTDKWIDAISFLIKSTDPSYVGGDTWGSEEALGITRPTDEESPTYAEDKQAFEDALETARSKVDRIAFAGQVPVNVYDAIPGQFIVAVQDGEGIKGIAVNEDDLTMKQYIKAVGIVQNILPDGRANVRVKVA